MIKVILWGPCAEYDKFLKYFECEILKNNMIIEAIVLNEENLIRSIDGIEVIRIDELLVRSYDYLIDMNQVDQRFVIRILELLNIPRSKVIPARVFGQPFFDLLRYIQVKESRVSIIANTCWGGYTYNSLGLEFTSPFINMYMNADDYLKMLGNFRRYMELPLHFIEEGYEPGLSRNFPVAGLDDIKLFLNHYTDFNSAAVIWNKRKSRINYDNLFVEMAINRQEDIDKFLGLPFKHKIGFTTFPCNEPDILYFPITDNGYLQNKYPGGFGYFVNSIAMAMSNECKPYDILKLLNHEEDYLRLSMYG